MSDPVQIPTTELRQWLDEESLRDWVQQQRWYASKSRTVAGIEIVEALSLREDPLLFLALVQTRFATGTHELYQLPLALHPSNEDVVEDVIAQTDEWTAYDAFAEPDRLLELVQRMESGEEIETADGTVRLPPSRRRRRGHRGLDRQGDRRRAIELLDRDR